MSRFCIKKARCTRSAYYTFDKFIIKIRKSMAPYVGLISEDIYLCEKKEIITLYSELNTLFVTKNIDFNKILLGYRYL